MIKLTRKGKILFGGVFAFFAVLLFAAMFSGGADDKPSPLRKPAALPKGYRFPLKGQAQRAGFREASSKTYKKLTYCAMFRDYATNRGVPLEFDALLAPDGRKSPYYYADPKTNREYLPAYFIAPTPDGLADAQEAATGDPENLGPCAQSTGGIILLGFDRDIVPTSPLVKVRGILWWSSVHLNPDQFTTADGEDTAPAPVVYVGEQQTLSVSQIARPAYRIRHLNTVIRNSRVAMRISRVEWANQETRVWVELINTTTSDLPPWTGPTVARLREEGKASYAVGELLDDEEERETLDDIFPEDDIPPKGGSLRGYLVFPQTDPAKTIFLTLPDGDSEFESAVERPITIKLPPELNEPVALDESAR